MTVYTYEEFMAMIEAKKKPEPKKDTKKDKKEWHKKTQ